MSTPDLKPQPKLQEKPFLAMPESTPKFFTAQQDHQRENYILLGGLERPALQWLATRVPAWVTPDELTGLGLFAAVLIFAGYVLTNIDKNYLWLASFGFVLNWVGDSLDGTLARYRHIERPRYGFFIDHSIDAFCEVLVFLGLGLSPYLHFNVAAMALIGYLLLSVLVYINTYVKGVFRISYIHLGPTEMRVIAIAANTAVFFVGNPGYQLPFGMVTLYDLLAIILTALFFGAFIVVTINQARDLNHLESIKPKKG